MAQENEIPKTLWVTLIFISIYTIVHFITGFVNPMQFIAVIVNLILLYGLYKGFKWAYFALFVAAILGSLFALTDSYFTFYIVLGANLIVVVPVLICTKFFFKTNKEVPAPAH